MANREDLCFGPFRLDRRQRLLFRDGEEVPLPPKVFDTLEALVEARGRVVGKSELIERVWPDVVVEEGNLTQNVFLLRRLLGDDEGGGRYIETLSRRGYRLTVEVREPGSDLRPLDRSAAADSAVPRHVGGGMASAAAGRRRWALVLAPAIGLVVAVLVALHPWAQQTTAAGDASVSPTIAVLPFVPVGSGEAAVAADRDLGLGLGMADALITRLARLEHWAVRPTSRVLGYAHGADPRSAAQDLQVARIVEGTFQRIDDRLRVSVQLVASGGEVRWAHTFEEPFEDVFALQDSIARQIAGSLVAALDREARDRLTWRPTDDLEAYELYLHGRYLASMLVDFERAIDNLERAVARDPEFALAWSSLAYAHLQAADLVHPSAYAFQEARRAALRAIELDPRLAEARLALATVLWQKDWDFPAADEQLRLALAEEPANTFVRGFRAYFLAQQGRFDDCRLETERMLTDDPRSVDTLLQGGSCLLAARDFVGAEVIFRRLVELEPGFWLGHALYGRALEQLGRREEAITHYQRATELETHLTEARGDLGRALGLSGRTREAEQVLEGLEAPEEGLFVSPFHLAMVQIGLGRESEALDALEQAVDAGSWYCTWLATAPELDPLRAEPRFQALLQRVGFSAPRAGRGA